MVQPLGFSEISVLPDAIRIIRHDATGLYVAISDNDPGLMVSGESEEDVQSRLPIIQQDLKSVRGY